ncbi:MAG TPA: hypothetical protein VN541_08705 [Tepidisphaeraceae bacterium]|nr:hypothetical protein [Tepidisphaeraceae bacterium]
MTQRDPFAAAVLELIRKSPGRLSWYQLDRSLSIQGMLPPDGLMKLLRRLESEGLIRSVSGQVASQSCYVLTDAGQIEVSAD